MLEDKYEFENPRRNPDGLAAPHLALNSTKFAINRALLTVWQYPSGEGGLFRS